MKKFIITLLILLIPFTFNLAYAAEDPDLSREIEIGKRAVAQIEQEWPLTSDPAVTSKLELIINKLEPHMQRRINWEVKLVKSEELNAFCLPGGFIFFTTGMIDKLDTDSELAAVMAHEMIHADRKHSLRMAADANKVNIAALAVMVLSGGAMAPVVLAQVAQVAITSSYTLELEAEADRLGLEALIESGYSPSGMITLFERFMAEEYKQPIHEYGIYLNHPETPKRLENAVKILHERNIPIERKYPLGLLRTEIKGNELKIDGMTIIKGNPEILKKARENLDKYLQLELAPYEIHVVGSGLYIGNNFIVENSEDLRENLLKAINLARAKHPTSKFFK